MSYDDIITTLCPVSKNPDYKNMFKIALKYLNEIKLSRYKALYFGSLQAGSEICMWTSQADFDKKYAVCCIYILGDLFDKMHNNMTELCEISLSMLYAMLSIYMNWKGEEIDDETNKLLEENDKYVKDKELESEFK